MLTLTAALQFLQRGELPELAVDTFQRVETLGPKALPALMSLAELVPYTRGKLRVEDMPNDLRPAYEMWLASQRERVDAIEESRRRLRSTMWAEVTLRESGDVGRAQVLRDWHRETWGIAEVEADLALREEQVDRAIRALAGQRPAAARRAS